MKKIQCAKCGQVFWSELKRVDENILGGGDWIQHPCPRCGAEWAIVPTAVKRPKAVRRKAKPAPKRRIRPKEAVGKKPVDFTPARIRSLRRRLGLSQRELAAIIGVNRATANMWEKGKIKPKKDKMAQFKGLMKIGKEDVKKLLTKKMPQQQKEKKPEGAQGGRPKEGRKEGAKKLRGRLENRP